MWCWSHLEKILGCWGKAPDLQSKLTSASRYYGDLIYVSYLLSLSVFTCWMRIITPH